MNPQDNQPPLNPSYRGVEGSIDYSGQQTQQSSSDQTQLPGWQQGPQPGGQQPQMVFVSRPLEPQRMEMSSEARRRHEESKARYPQLNLSEGEYIISVVSRHPIGLLRIWAIVGLLIALLLGVAGLFSVGLGGGEPLFPETVVLIPVLLLSMLILLFGFMEMSVYNGNQFFLTNESVIQQIQTSLFSKREQTVSLGNIEDASYTQHGILPHMFNFGMIRLSTEGDETTYRFDYASHPKKQVATLNNAVEAFKNGRPVNPDES